MFEFFLKEVKMEEETKEIETRYVTENLLLQLSKLHLEGNQQSYSWDT